MLNKQQALDYLRSLKDRYVDFDGYYGAQCADLVVDYAYKLSEGQVRIWGNAINIPFNNYPSDWKVVKNTPEYIPPVGAIVVWYGGYFTKYGHTGIIWDNSGGTKSCVVLEQNWDSLASSPAKLRTDYYVNVQYFIIPPSISADNALPVRRKEPTVKQKSPVGAPKVAVGSKVPKSLPWSDRAKYIAKADQYGVSIAKRTGTAGNYKWTVTKQTYQPGAVFYVFQVQNGWARVYSPNNNGWVWHERLQVTKAL